LRSFAWRRSMMPRMRSRTCWCAVHP
jgi:hypothetical protein